MIFILAAILMTGILAESDLDKEVDKSKWKSVGMDFEPSSRPMAPSELNARLKATKPKIDKDEIKANREKVKAWREELKKV